MKKPPQNPDDIALGNPGHLQITGSRIAPEVDFNPINGHLVTSGNLQPEDAADYFDSVLDWLKSYLNTKPAFVSLTFNVRNFNTVSTKVIADILQVLSSAFENQD